MNKPVSSFSKQECLRYIRDIRQKDNHTFTITWNDNQSFDYRLSELQRQCPCARCIEDGTSAVDDAVKATRIHNVGRYALRIEFSQGCTAGIYDFDLLYKCGERGS